jgi:hypothetical protein
MPISSRRLTGRKQASSWSEAAQAHARVCIANGRVGQSKCTFRDQGNEREMFQTKVTPKMFRTDDMCMIADAEAYWGNRWSRAE